MPIKTQHDEMPVLNLTSMIDVLFLLVLFFMLSSEFTRLERQIGLKVPQVVDRGALTSAPEKKVVDVYSDGEIYLDRKNVSLEELGAQLTAAHQQYAALGVLVRGDGAGTFQRVAEVLNTCKQSGIGELGIAVKVERMTTTR